MNNSSNEPDPLLDQHDEYKHVETLEHLAACPVCGSTASLYQHSKSLVSPTSKLVCCDRGDSIGPQDGIIAAGCLLFLPPRDFYRATKNDAISYWNKYAAALELLRQQN
jgi:hypothetical protein